MQQIINFIFKNSILLLFLLLLGISLTFTVQSHSYHKSRYISSANAVTGFVYQQIDNVKQYLNLREENERLARENAVLQSIVYNSKDSVELSLLPLPKELENYHVITSKVIHNSFNVHENYITINTGEKDGVKTDMAVINSLGIVGEIDKTSNGYATVLSILNTKSRINAKIKKSNHFGFLSWNGENTGFVQLTEIPRLASVRKGDTIVTGGSSITFPENIPVGTIDKIYVDKRTNYYTLDVRLFNDMTNLGHVYIIENKNREEIINLQEESQNE